MLQRSIHRALATLLQIDPAQRSGMLIVVLLFLITLNLSSNVLYAWLALNPWGNWLMFLSPFLLIGLAIYWLAKLMQPSTTSHELIHGPQPTAHTGLIWLLSTFNTSEKLLDGSTVRYDFKELESALAAPNRDHARIKQLVEGRNSNLRPFMAAFRHHAASGTLKHLWLITTEDLPDPVRTEHLQAGSHQLAPLIQKLLHEIYPWPAITIHANIEKLIVHPHKIADTYLAVQSIFQAEAPRLGLAPESIIADLTGGRVTMSCGMILACQPNAWHMQYTSTEFDPATSARPDEPLPTQVTVDLRTVLRQSLEASERQL